MAGHLAGQIFFPSLGLPDVGPYQILVMAEVCKMLF